MQHLFAGSLVGMAAQSDNPEAAIKTLPIWRGSIEIEPLLGGITNKNYLVVDRERRVVVRFGGDIPVHGVMRFNEQAASMAASAAEISPLVLFAGPTGTLFLNMFRVRPLARRTCVVIVIDASP